jgi:signal transduction histidine kinase/ActR/RegA family two-component response regulator
MPTDPLATPAPVAPLPEAGLPPAAPANVLAPGRPAPPSPPEAVLARFTEGLVEAADVAEVAGHLLSACLQVSPARVARVLLPAGAGEALELACTRAEPPGSPPAQHLHGGVHLPSAPAGGGWLAGEAERALQPVLARDGAVGGRWWAAPVDALGPHPAGLLVLGLEAPGPFEGPGGGLGAVEALARVATLALDRLRQGGALERARAVAAAEAEARARAEERYRFLAEAGQGLATSLDVEVVLQELARLTALRLADACTVHVADGGGGLRQVAFASALPEGSALREQWDAAGRAAARPPPSALEALGARRTVLAEEPEGGRAARGHAAQVLSVPLLGRDRVHAVLTLTVERAGRRLRPEDVALAEELAHRAVLAVDNARLYREAHHARAAAEQESHVRRAAEERQRFLAEVSRVLGATLDAEEMLRSLARLAVPRFADGCAVDLVEADGSLRRVAASHRDPTKAEVAFRLAEEFPGSLDAAIGPPSVVRTGVSERVAVVRDAHLEAQARSPEHLALLRRLGVGALLCVPLWVRGRVAGAVTLVQGESGRRFARADQVVAEDLAARAGFALENARLYADLQEEDRRKDAFLAMLAHELRNPLAPVQVAARLLKQGTDRPEVLERARAVIERQTRHMARLVDDLLDVSRITRGKIELRRERTPLQLLIQRAAELAHPMLQARQHALTVACPERPLWLEVDPVRLEQVLVNLLNNAAKYTDPGGRIHVAVQAEGGAVQVSVRDTGIGIGPDMLPRVFELFAQERRASDRAQGGLGIGLTLVRQLVELHGGSVTAHSEGVGRGSEFRVSLPYSELEAPPEAPAAHLDSHARALEVLVVDDNVDAAETLAELLQVWGHTVRVVHDGFAALEAAGAHAPDVVLLDIGLPRMDGFEVARRLRANPAHARCTLVALTGYGQSEDRARAHEAGFDHHLTKPVDLQVLARVLAACGLGEQGARPGEGQGAVS